MAGSEWDSDSLETNLENSSTIVGELSEFAPKLDDHLEVSPNGLFRTVTPWLTPVGVVVWIVLLAVPSGAVPAQSLTDLLGGFDETRLAQIERPTQSQGDGVRRWSIRPESRRELAKLVYRIQRLSPSLMKTRLTASQSPPVTGDAVALVGEIVSLASVSVPDDLEMMLDLPRLSLVGVRTNQGMMVDLVIDALPARAVIGDALEVVVVWMESLDTDGSHGWAVGGRAQWRSANPTSVDHRVLAAFGVNLSWLADVAKLDRKSLNATDGEVFFAMLGAAGRLDQTQQGEMSSLVSDMRRQASRPRLLDLLRTPSEFTGQWIELEMETVRWSRIEIESAARRIEAGLNAYYQIDAIGDLGDVRLQLKTGEGKLVTMSNRYPISLVSPTLPECLTPPNRGGAIAGDASVGVRVGGFFYRLWSYESDLMAEYDGKQFAPLIIAADIQPLVSDSADPIGVGVIGQLAAVATVLAILATTLFHFVSRRGDQRAKRARHSVDSHLNLPTQHELSE
ncbi:MAG: hypothetical protein AAGJ40_19995 [Planctomycetota bacterium]